MENHQDITRERFRADSYRFLSACFCLPQKELFIRENIFKNLTDTLTRTCAEAVAFSSEMVRAFSESDEEELTVEYARLFVGPYELKAPPYGSVYLDGERRVMGNSTMEVIRLYEEAGLVIDKDFKELPDHIAVELEFMNYLIYKEIDTYMKSKFEDVMEVLRHQELFLKKYLGAWISNFSKAIAENSDNSFYISLAKCTEVFIKTDMDYISETLRKIL